MSSYSQDYTLSRDSLARLTINAGAADVTLLPYGGEPYVKMSVERFGVCFGNPELEVEQSGGKTSINVISRGVFITLGQIRINLDIRIPAGSTRDLDVRIASGRFICNTFTFDTITGRLASGDMRLEKVSANTTGFSVASGSLSLNEVSFKKAKLTLTSGSIRAALAASNECQLETTATSGDMKVSGAFTSIRASSLSGNTRIISSIAPEAITGNVTSGHLSLRIPETAEGFTANYSCSSGAFLTDFLSAGIKRKGAITSGNGKAVYTFTIASGAIALKKLH